MKLVLHILGKDIRGLRWEIAATVMLTMVTVLFELPGRYSSLKDLGQYWSQPAIVLAWALLVLRVVQRDGLVGTEHDWLTRPVRRWQVAAAKALFVGLFVVVPMVIRDAIVVAANGFPVVDYVPGLVWSVVVRIGVFLLPAAALGVVARTIPQALLVGLGFAIAASVGDAPVVAWEGLNWVPMGLAALAGAITAALVLWMQYSRRWTTRVRVLGAVGVLGAVVVPLVLPWRAAFFCQRLFTSEAMDASRMVVQVGAAATLWNTHWPVIDGKVRIQLPMVITGAPSGYKVRVLRVDGMAGLGLRLDQGGPSRHYAQPDGGAYYGVTVEMSEAAFVAAREQPARVRGRVYLAVLAPRAKREFTFENGPQMVPGVGVCQADFGRIPVFYCRTPFRTPTETRVTFSSIEPSQGAALASMATLSALSSLSPLPFEFSLAPMRGVAAAINRLEYNGELPAAKGPASGRITYETWVPVTYIEREFDVSGWSWGDYRLPFQ